MSLTVLRPLFAIILVIGSIAVVSPRQASAAGPWYVATTGDDSNSCLSPGTPCATINGAIGKASSGDTVNVAEGTYTGTGSEVVLIDRDVTLSGGWNDTFTSQSGMSTIDGQAARRGITVASGVTAIVQQFTLQNGSSDLGGGIMNFGSLTLNNSRVSGNTALLGGGGISNNDAGIEGLRILIVNNSIISNNSASHFGSNGGGIRNGYNSIVILNNSTVSGNTVAISGCGGDGAGGGIFIADDNSSIAVLNNSTVSNNQACNSGGGIFSRGVLNINNSTISNNAVTDPLADGGGISVVNSVTLQDTIIADNTVIQDPFGRPDCDAQFGISQTVINSLGYNLISNSYGCIMTNASGDQLDVDPLLGPLQDNGGPTFTHALLPGSPAIDAGNPAGCTDQNGTLLTTDQRGVSRPQGTRCDIGAFELEVTNPVLEVAIDIKPGNARNRIEIEPGDDEKVSVAILSTAQFSAVHQVDRTSLTFGVTGDENSLYFKGRKLLPGCQVRDVNRDRLLDLVCKFIISKSGFEPGDTRGILKGLTVEGAPFEGSDSVIIQDG